MGTPSPRIVLSAHADDSVTANSGLPHDEEVVKASTPINQARIDELLGETHPQVAFWGIVSEVMQRLGKRRRNADVSMRDFVNEFIVLMEREKDFFLREFGIRF